MLGNLSAERGRTGRNHRVGWVEVCLALGSQSTRSLFPQRIGDYSACGSICNPSVSVCLYPERGMASVVLLAQSHWGCSSVSSGKLCRFRATCGVICMD